MISSASRVQGNNLCMEFAKQISHSRGHHVLSQEKNKEVWHQSVLSIDGFALASQAKFHVKGLH